MLGKTEGRRRSGQQRTRWLDGISDSADMSLSQPREMVEEGEAWHAALQGVAKSQTRLVMKNSLCKTSVVILFKLSTSTYCGNLHFVGTFLSVFKTVTTELHSILINVQ